MPPAATGRWMPFSRPLSASPASTLNYAIFKSVTNVTGGEDAQGEVRVEVEHEGRTQRGQAVSTDIIEASAQAFLQAINRLAMHRQLRLNPQTEEVAMT